MKKLVFYVRPLTSSAGSFSRSAASVLEKLGLKPVREPYSRYGRVPFRVERGLEIQTQHDQRSI